MKTFRQLSLGFLSTGHGIGQQNACASLLEKCSSIQTLDQVHALMLTNGLHQNTLQTKLATMYAAMFDLEDARLLFDRIPQPKLCLLNVMIREYARNGSHMEALSLYYQMLKVRLYPDNFTFPYVLKACASSSDLQKGREIHSHVIINGLGVGVFVANSLVDMYAKCGDLEDARQVFDKMPQRDVVSWNAMIAGYAQNGCPNEALELYVEMQGGDARPDLVTVRSVLPACASLAASQQGKWIHGYVVKSGFELDVIVGTALVAMYAKCGRVKEARQMFDKMCGRDVVSWSAMIGGYAWNGHAKEALKLFYEMQLTDLKPDLATLKIVIPVYAYLAAPQAGKWIHGYLIKRGFESDVSVGTALIDMYAKCGTIQMARGVFEKMCEKDVVSWSAMIAGYGMHGCGKNALELFYQMEKTGVRPDQITFVCVLSACSHAGLLDKGWQCLNSMIQDYGIQPTVEHYACMVDLLGRAGRLDEAEDLIKNMPSTPDAGVWGALLGACRIHGNIELGERVANRLFVLDPKDTGHYVLLSNMFAAAGKWDGVAKMRAIMKNRGLKMKPGCTLIEIDNKAHSFIANDRSHPQSDQIYAALESLSVQMKDAGYVPNTSLVLHDVTEDVNEHMFWETQ